jgi:predicted nucleotidyltransferase component of viral defense system
LYSEKVLLPPRHVSGPHVYSSQGMYSIICNKKVGNVQVLYIMSSARNNSISMAFHKSFPVCNWELYNMLELFLKKLLIFFQTFFVILLKCLQEAQCSQFLDFRKITLEFKIIINVWFFFKYVKVLSLTQRENKGKAWWSFLSKLG